MLTMHTHVFNKSYQRSVLVCMIGKVLNNHFVHPNDSTQR